MPSNSGYVWIKEEEGFTPVASKLQGQSGKREKVRTVGHGYNIDAQTDPLQDFADAGVSPDRAKAIMDGRTAITKEEAGRLFDVSLVRAARETASIIPNMEKVPKPIQDVLISMTYQMGREGLRSFKQMRLALNERDYKGMAKEIMDSKFARVDSTARARRTAKRVLDFAKTLPDPPPKPSEQELIEQAKREATAKRLAQSYSRKMLEDRLVNSFKQMKKNDEANQPTEDKE
jgi:GH24 family phage-related lysozyme (muramidase)